MIQIEMYTTAVQTQQRHTVPPSKPCSGLIHDPLPNEDQVPGMEKWPKQLSTAAASSITGHFSRSPASTTGEHKMRFITRWSSGEKDEATIKKPKSRAAKRNCTLDKGCHQQVSLHDLSSINPILTNILLAFNSSLSVLSHLDRFSFSGHTIVDSVADYDV